MRLRFWLAVGLAAVIGVAGVQGIAQATESPGSADRGTTERYEPTEYFKGIYFGVGPVADEVPELHPRRTPEEQREMERLANELGSYIESEFPGHIAEFADAVRSGDHVKTRGALMATGDLVGDTYLRLYPGELPPGACDEGYCERELAKVRDQDVGVFVIKQVFVAIQVWRYVYLWDDEAAHLPPWQGDANLYIDQLTNIIVEQLGMTH